MPEQKTKISVASEKPKRAGIQSANQSLGICATKMMNIAKPRKKSSRGSRRLGVPALLLTSECGLFFISRHRNRKETRDLRVHLATLEVVCRYLHSDDGPHAQW